MELKIEHSPIKVGDIVTFDRTQINCNDFRLKSIISARVDSVYISCGQYAVSLTDIDYRNEIGISAGRYQCFAKRLCLVPTPAATRYSVWN